MQSKSENISELPEDWVYEYAVIRFCPAVEREEFLNIGLVMMCKKRRWLRSRATLDRERLRAMFPKADLDQLESQLKGFDRVASGRPSPIGVLEPHERFRWLTAVRSACITTSRPHPGLTHDLDSTFERLYAELVE